MTTTRRATEADVSLFKEVRLRALKESPEAFGSTYQGAIVRDNESWREQLLSTISGPWRNMQFAFRGDDCVGIAALYRHEGAESGDIIQMWVAPEARGTEAATLLVSTLLGWAREAGFAEVCLNVTNTNKRGIHFYEKCGFVATRETVEVDLSRGLSGIRMKTDLM